jgi:hypothetical protein
MVDYSQGQEDADGCRRVWELCQPLVNLPISKGVPQMTTTPNLESYRYEIPNLELFLSLEPDPEQQFLAIDSQVRRFERMVSDWPALARMCKAVDTGKLWKHGGYKSFTNWLENAAPKCSSSIYAYIAQLSNLEGDFSDDEMMAMPPESAKFIAETVTSHEHRKNPAVKAASKKKKAECVKAVREALPELHLEDIVNVTFTESQIAAIDLVCDTYRGRMNEPDLSRATCIEGVMADWGLECP